MCNNQESIELATDIDPSRINISIFIRRTKGLKYLKIVLMLQLSQGKATRR